MQNSNHHATVELLGTGHVLQVFAGIVTVSVGHCHPKVVAAVDRQNHLLQHTTNIYLNNEIAEYAQELTSTLPGKLKVGRPFPCYVTLAPADCSLCATCHWHWQNL